MKKAFALMLSLMLALSFLTAVAEEKPINPTTIDFSVSFDESVLLALLGTEISQENQALINTILPLLKKAGGRLIITPEGGEASFTLNSNAVATLGAYPEENNLKILSDLFPNYAIEIPMEAVTAAVNEDDAARMESAFTSIIAILESEMAPGENAVETGAYTLDGFTFDTKTTEYRTLQQCANDISAIYAKVMADETLKPMAESLLASLEMQDLPRKLASSDFSQVSGGVEIITYTAKDSQNQYLTMAIKDLGATFSAKCSLIDSKLSCQLVASEQPDLTAEQAKVLALTAENTLLLEGEFVPGEKEKDLSARLDLYAGMYVGAQLKSAVLPFIGQAITLDVNLVPGGAPILSFSGLIFDGGQLTLPASLAPATTITLDPSLLETEEGAAALNALAYELGNDISTFGLTTALGNAAAAMPEEVSALIAYIMASPDNASGIPLF